MAPLTAQLPLAEPALLGKPAVAPGTLFIGLTRLMLTVAATVTIAATGGIR